MTSFFLKFTKMHGAGNDFIILNGIDQNLSNFTAKNWKKLAHRRFGIGADQILIVERSNLVDVKFKYRIINSDGNEVEQCGNGCRCFMKFIQDQQLTKNKIVRVEVSNKIITLIENAQGNIIVDMGSPILQSDLIPFNPFSFAKRNIENATLYALEINRQVFWIHPISFGNPHAIQIVDDIDKHNVESIGSAIESHFSFPKKVNVGFMQILSKSKIKLRVFERGAKETLSCGSGACAAVVSGILQGRLDNFVSVFTRGGELTIEWDGKSTHSVKMSGPAKKVFEGEIQLDL